MTPPLVSIIIPAFNYERYVGRAIESALAQDYVPIEIVVVDDGSTDATAAAARAYESRGVCVISQPNQGLAAARNTGIQNSSGELLFFLDADDLLEPSGIRQLVVELSQKDDSWAMVACQAKVMLPDGSVISPDSGPARATEVTWAELLLGSRFPCTVLIRRAALAACGGFDSGYHRLGCEDRDMWLRVAEKFRIWTMPDRLVIVAFHGNNMSSDPHRQLAGIRRCLSKALGSPRAASLGIAARLRIRSNFHSTAALLFAEQHRVLRQLWHSLAALLLWPLPGLSAQSGRSQGHRVKRLAVALRSLWRRTFSSS